MEIINYIMGTSIKNKHHTFKNSCSSSLSCGLTLNNNLTGSRRPTATLFSLGVLAFI